MGKKLVEHYKRGFFGRLVQIAFWLANAVMAAWMIGVWHAATTAGIGIAATGMLLFFWILVLMVGGVLMLLTRGRKIIEEIED